MLLSNSIKLMHPKGSLLNPLSALQQQLRTTFILKRKYPVPLQKYPERPRRFRPRQYIYELIKHTCTEKTPQLNLILTHYVDGLGNTGDPVTVKANYGYNKLLLPGLAVYASPENVDKFKDYKSTEDEIKHSSPFAQSMAKHLSDMCLLVAMNKFSPWTLKAWHVRASFRKCGYVVPEETITMPQKEIKGPDVNLQDREFFVVVTINDCETAKVRCRIHHWSSDLTQSNPYDERLWVDSPGPVFPEDGPILEAMPKRWLTKK